MTDERYTFVEDVREKKRTARGYHNKVRKGGAMKLPSDFMTRKERDAMNSDVKSFKLDKPMGWKEFKGMPDDLKIEYLTKPRDEHGGGLQTIADMLGCAKATLWRYTSELGVTFLRQSKEREARWNEFISGAETNAGEEPHEVFPEPKQTQETNNIAILLAMLAGTGAKLPLR